MSLIQEGIARRFDRALQGLERTAIRSLDAALTQSARELEREVQRLYNRARGEVPLGAQPEVGEARARVLLEQVEALTDVTRNAPARLTLEQLIEAAHRVGYDAATAHLNAYQRRALRMSSRVPVDTMMAATGVSGRLQTIGLARAAAGQASLIQHGAKASEAIERHIINGIVRGRGWRTVATSIRKEVSITRHAAERIVRTESVGAADAARRARYEQAGVEFVSVLVTMDDRLCGYCLARAGKRYKRDDIILPFHPNCRCTTVPWRPEWSEAGIDDDEWWVDHQAESVERSEEPARSGPAPSERWRGLTAAPKPVWAPGMPSRAVQAATAAVTAAAQAARAAAPEPGLPSRPPGTMASVSDAFSMRLKTKKLTREAEGAMAAIDNVHYLAATDRIPFANTTAEGINGHYKHAKYARRATEVRLNAKGPTPRLTTAHEIGHMIDHLHLGDNRGKFGSHLRSPEVDAWLKAVRESAAYKRLEEIRASPRRLAIMQDNGEWYDVTNSRLRYLMSNEELFARSYAQFIAEESGDAVMMAELNTKFHQYSALNGQWLPEDFKPIREAFRSLFRSKGWLKP